MVEKPPVLEAGATVRRRNITEKQYVLAFDRNIAIINEIGYIHTVSREGFFKYYVST